MVIFHPTQSLFEHARDLESLGLHWKQYIGLGFGSVLCSVSVTRVTVLYLCGTRCMDQFASVTVNVGVRQTQLLQ